MSSGPEERRQVRPWPPSGDQAELVNRVARSAAKDDRRDPLALRLCRAATGVVGADEAAITVSTGRLERFTLCATGEVSARFEDLQEVIGEGPSVEAYRTGRPVSLDLDGTDRRWPRLAEAALEILGSVALRAYPIHPGPHVLGATTFYLRQPRPLHHPEPTVQTLVDSIGVALLADDASLGATLGSDLLISGPWAERARIHQATGMVVAQLGLGTGDALALLRARAFAHDLTLLETAGAVLDRSLRFAPDDVPGLDADPATRSDSRKDPA